MSEGLISPGFEPPERRMGVSLTGRRVRLERLSLHHMPALHALLSDDDLADAWPLLGHEVPGPELASYLWSLSDIQFTVMRRDSDEPIGLVQGLNAGHLNGTVACGIAIAKPLWQAGWPLEALVLFFDYLFRGLGFRKIYFSSPTSVKARLGPGVDHFLRTEAIFREHVRVDEAYEDLWMMSLHRDQWNPAEVEMITGNRPPPSGGG